MDNAFDFLDYPKTPIEISITSSSERKYRLHSCKREPQTVEWIESFEDNTVFFDVGANVGCYSLVAAAQNALGRSNIQVYSFEPASVNFTKLLTNIRRNRFDHLITPVNIALGDTSASSVLNYYDGGGAGEYSIGEAGSSGHQLNRMLDYEDKPFKSLLCQNVLSMTLDDFSRMFRLYPTAIKIDVDGIENLVLRGASTLIDDLRLKSVLVEINGGKDDFLFEVMHNHNFTITHHTSHNNVLFMRR